MDTIQKISFDFWPFIDNHEAFPFFKILMNDGRSFLIQNTLIQDVDYFIWISNDKMDISTLNKFTTKKSIIFQCYSGSPEISHSLTVSDDYKMNLIGCSAIYESSNEQWRPIKNDGDYTVQMASKADMRALPNENDSAARHDYVEQIRIAFNDESTNVFVLKYRQQPVSFLVLSDIQSQKYGYRYKHISPIYTMPQHRHKGFASHLTQAVLNLYPNCKFMYVADSIENKASASVAEGTGFSKLGYNLQIKIQNAVVGR